MTATIIDYIKLFPFRFILLLVIFIILFLFIYLLLKYLASNKGHSFSRNANSHLKLNKFNSAVLFFSGIFLGIFACLVLYHSSKQRENLSISDSPYVFGIDISHYQGKINWNELRNSHHPIEYIFIRATMGVDGKDKEFKRNWKEAKSQGFIVGAYHYYRPNENSSQQFANFKSSVSLQSGDFFPVLDIEELGMYGIDNLRQGVLNWLALAENEYGVKPIVYSGKHFYEQHLKGYIDDYPLWIASYSGKHTVDNIKWEFHQFTDQVRVNGIKTKVDGNDFNGDLKDLQRYCLP